MARKDMTDLIKDLEAQGFGVRRTQKNHWMVYGPTQGLVATFASTPSDPRSVKNGLAALKRAGYTPPKKRG